MRVCVLDIEPIDPPQGGSRLRLKGLYHALGSAFETLYVGAYHWRGPGPRRLRHSPGFEELTIPFSERHFAAARELQAAAGGATVIDASFPRLGRLSEAFCAHARDAARQADIVVFSHPWVFAVVGDVIHPQRQLVVYDAHNVEGDLRRELLGDSPTGRAIAAEAEALEGALCRLADLVVACSHPDRRRLIDMYRLDPSRTRVLGNGTFAGRIVPATPAGRSGARSALGVGPELLAIFIGGRYPPNIDAARFIGERLAPECPELTFAIVGDAGDALAEGAPRTPLADNVRITGRVDDTTLKRWLQAADLGLNPVTAGSGTNIKMLDYMAAGLPVLSTAFGMRGIADNGASIQTDRERFGTELRRLAGDPDRRATMGRAGRRLVEREYHWPTSSAELGTILARASDRQRPRPLFSVAVPTLDRPDKVRRLLDLLAAQQERDFEVIIVDQSEKPFAAGDFGIEVVVLHSPVRGQCHARNLAAAVARGRILAFTDDDCEPGEAWLAEARKRFEGDPIVGLEGRIASSRMDDPRWRSVHNHGVEGIGFMSCNLFATAAAFQLAGGFDAAFDDHQHRYDSDLGWRLQEIGDVPFSEEAFVYHPPWPRSIARESEARRNELFEADALLLRRHPKRYRELFLRECQWRKGAGFREPFLRGLASLDMAVPDYARDKLADGGGR